MTDKIRTIVADCGGPTAISRKSRDMDPDDYVKPISVSDWYHNGIPEKRWAVVMALSELTEAELHAANNAVRLSKKKPDPTIEVHAA